MRRGLVLRIVAVLPACALAACSGHRDAAIHDAPASHADAPAHPDAASHLDAPRDAGSQLDAVTQLDAMMPIDAAHVDAARVDAAHVDATHVDAAHVDAAHVDAALDAVVTHDAGSPDASSPLDAGAPSEVTCYTEGDPAQSCTLPQHCCFSNYSAQHDGFCTTTTCVYGTIDCDGPEDCAGGQHCCSHALFDADGALTGYALGCQVTACGTAPGDHELCHLTGPACSNGGTCVTAYGHANDLPRTLDICQ